MLDRINDGDNIRRRTYDDEGHRIISIAKLECVEDFTEETCFSVARDLYVRGHYKVKPGYREVRVTRSHMNASQQKGRFSKI